MTTRLVLTDVISTSMCSSKDNKAWTVAQTRRYLMDDRAAERARGEPAHYAARYYEHFIEWVFPDGVRKVFERHCDDDGRILMYVFKVEPVLSTQISIHTA